MKWNLRLAVSNLLLSALLLAPAFGEEETGTERQRDELIEKANNILRENGLKSAHVIKSPEGRLVLAGTFDTYDEFLFALMLMNVHFGFDKVKPVYDNRVAIIKKSTAELCFPYALKGQLCPYGRFPIEKREAPQKEPGVKRYALVIGVRNFGGEFILKEQGETKKGRMKDVDGADNDAIAFAEYLKKKGYEVKLFVNQEATVANVKRAIEEIYSKAKDGDEVVLFAASHGAPVDENGEVGIVLYDTTGLLDTTGALRNCKVNDIKKNIHTDAAEKMCTLVKNSLSIREHILNTFADKKVNLVVLLDACYSGDALRSYVGIGLPYQIATTKEYEDAIRKNALNLSIMATAASGDRKSWGGSIVGDFRKRLIDLAGGSPRFISLPDTATSQTATSQVGGGTRGITVENVGAVEKGQKGKAVSQQKSAGQQKVVSQQGQATQGSERSAPGEHGVFTAFILEGLAKYNDSLATAYEKSKDDINYVSEQMCKSKAEGGSKICPPGGQNPMLYRIRKEDHIFGR